jgi:hypothetical protein
VGTKLVSKKVKVKKSVIINKDKSKKSEEFVKEKFNPKSVIGRTATISNCSKGLVIGKVNIYLNIFNISEEEGLEPSTVGFENRCSNQLSYSS